ncbi:MAG: hypothetical protein OCD01_04125 [Fibrobacterales bacterium]
MKFLLLSALIIIIFSSCITQNTSNSKPSIYGTYVNFFRSHEGVVGYRDKLGWNDTLIINSDSILSIHTETDTVYYPYFIDNNNLLSDKQYICIPWEYNTELNEVVTYNQYLEKLDFDQSNTNELSRHTEDWCNNPATAYGYQVYNDTLDIIYWDGFIKIK